MPSETSRAVLVVDDEPAGLETACAMFETFGFVAHRASTATEALRLLSGPVHLDLLYSDVRMPDFNGTDLAQKARKLRPELPVILTSAWLDGIHVERARFLRKPVRLHDLYACVRYAMLDGPAEPAETAGF
jgi:DNA-binding NtrC family response regulator